MWCWCKTYVISLVFIMQSSPVGEKEAELKFQGSLAGSDSIRKALWCSLLLTIFISLHTRLHYLLVIDLLQFLSVARGSFIRMNKRKKLKFWLLVKKYIGVLIQNNPYFIHDLLLATWGESLPFRCQCLWYENHFEVGCSEVALPRRWLKSLPSIQF